MTHDTYMCTYTSFKSASRPSGDIIVFDDKDYKAASGVRDKVGVAAQISSDELRFLDLKAGRGALERSTGATHCQFAVVNMAGFLVMSVGRNALTMTRAGYPAKLTLGDWPSQPYLDMNLVSQIVASTGGANT